MICVRGNHEDHAFFDNLEKRTFKAAYSLLTFIKKVFVCKSGLKQELRAENEVLTFVGIGRIGDRKGRTEKRFIQEYERKEIKKLLRT